ncbi:MAG: Rrf2 family transcriptional regulator [candidate division KSB1 bacterium]|jgi:Rrf2 family protein|nr:Rrf2 family transcriptional regulator [candidate division KSB1 bacterium]
MLRLSKKVEYSLIALKHMAERKPGELTSARELADCYDISQELLGKLLQTLHKNGFIDSVQGPRGGYHLAKSPEEISVNAVIEAIDGEINIVDCGDCQRLKRCRIYKPMQRIQDDIHAYFSGLTLRDFTTKRRMAASGM